MRQSTRFIDWIGVRTASVGAAVVVLICGLIACAEDAPRAGFALKRATVEGNVGRVRELLSAGVDPNAGPYRASGPALGAAASGRRREVVRMLLEAGANPNLANDWGYTPLMAAVSGGDLSIVDALIVAGADVDAATTRNGTTALLSAARHGNREVVQRLLDAGADPLKRSLAGATPRDIARRYDHPEVEQVLLAAERAAN